jgi:hypothetical protein
VKRWPEVEGCALWARSYEPADFRLLREQPRGNTAVSARSRNQRNLGWQSSQTL